MAVLQAREPDRTQRVARAGEIRSERDLVVRALPDEVAARILREVAGATAPLDAARSRLQQTGHELRERRLA